MWATWEKLSLSDKVRVGIFTTLWLLVLIAVVMFASKRAGLPLVIGAALMAIPVIMRRTKQYHQDTAQRQGSSDRREE